MDLVYHERQVGRMCAQHALNMLLQGNYFTADNLVAIAHELDARERAVLGDESHFQSQNYDEVITEALRRQANLHLEALDSPAAFKIRQNPSMGQAYICHYEDHWFALRKIGTTWFVLNSLFKSPRIVSETFMELYITQLYTEGWSIYLVEGQLPSCAADNVPREFWNETRRSRKFENDLEKALALSLNESAQPWIASNSPDDELTATSASLSKQTEELELQRALEESLREANRLKSLKTAESSMVHEAMKQSLQEPEESAASTSMSGKCQSKDDQNSQSSSSRSDQFAEKSREINSLISLFPNGIVPESLLGDALNKMFDKWNCLLSQVVTEVDQTQPIPEHIKETAEFAFRDACLGMNSELTHISMNWQLKNPDELTKQEVADYKKSLQRQENLLEKIKHRIDEEIDFSLHDTFE
uniref:ubiquitinyl hydrolase 1 n=1 Tax=Meloidogyne javanica TaxID=6303 RepID=A0A915M6T1_MELJA